jgi:hypothetical protein
MRRAIILAIGMIAATVLFAGPVRADSDEPSTTNTTLPSGAVDIGDGFAFTAATITPLDGSAPRTLDAYHAAVFVQSWIGTAFFGQPNIIDPPATAPVSRVDVTGSWGVLSGYMVVYYATDGTSVWISFPDGQTPSPTPPASPPPPTVWFVGTQQVLDAINGTATLVPTAGVVDKPTTNKPAASKGSSSAAIWVVVVVVLLVAVAAAVFIIRRRRAVAA